MDAVPHPGQCGATLVSVLSGSPLVSLTVDLDATFMGVLPAFPLVSLPVDPQDVVCRPLSPVVMKGSLVRELTPGNNFVISMLHAHALACACLGPVEMSTLGRFFVETRLVQRRPQAERL